MILAGKYILVKSQKDTVYVELTDHRNNKEAAAETSYSGNQFLRSSSLKKKRRRTINEPLGDNHDLFDCVTRNKVAQAETAVI